MSVPLTKHRFTVDKYHRMIQAGILGEDDRVELLDGEIARMTAIGSRHAACVNRLTKLLIAQLGGAAIVSPQNPIRLGTHSEPEPDLAVLRPQPDYYAAAHPAPADVLLIVEVAESSTQTDRDVKIPLYGRAGIVETWLADLSANIVEVFRTPSAIGYKDIRKAAPGDRLSPQTVPSLSFSVDEILSPE